MAGDLRPDLGDPPASWAERQVGALHLVACAAATREAVAEAVIGAALDITDGTGAAMCTRRGHQVLGIAAAGLLMHVTGSTRPLNVGLAGAALLSGHPEVCPDTRADERLDQVAVAQHSVRSAVAVPLRLGGAVQDVLTVVATHPHAFDDAAVERLTQLAATAEARLETVTALAEVAHREQVLREALETAVDGHAIYDAVCDENGRVVDLVGAYLNSKGAMLRGLDEPEGWVGSSLVSRRDDVGSVMVDHFLLVARTGVPRRFRLDLETRQGFRSCEVTATRRGTSERAGVIAVFHDVTDQRLAADRLADHERQLTEAQRLAGVGSWEWVPDPDDPRELFDGGGTLVWSDQLFHLLGLQPGSVTPSQARWTEQIVPEDRAIRTDALRNLIAERASSVTVHYRVVRPDGETVWLQGSFEAEYGEDGRPVRVHGTALDISRQRESEAQLRLAEEQFRLALDLAPVGVALIDLQSHWLRVNDALCALIGQPRDVLLGRPINEVWPEADPERERQEWIDLVRGKLSRLNREVRVERPDGTVVWVRATASLLRTDDGAPRHVIAHAEDVTDERARQADLQRQANTDALTGLLNRRGWEHALLRQLDAAAASELPLAIGLLDLDRFKVYNDTFGHPAGDKLLAEAARAWRDYLAEHAPRATLARLGGEEFVVALPDCMADAAREVLTALCDLTPRGQTTSAGTTEWVRGEEAGETLARADGALYTAKRKGRNRVIAVLGA